MILRTYACPGETRPPTCRCACYGCRHHCSAHNPPALHRWRKIMDRTFWQRFSDALHHRYPQPEPVHIPRRGDAVEQWLTAKRDEFSEAVDTQWDTIDDLLNDYRLHAALQTPLDQAVTEDGDE